MIDAPLYAVRDNIREAGLGYSQETCRVTDDGHPPPFAGDVFVAVHQGPYRSTADNVLNEYYSFFVTLTVRVTIPPRPGGRAVAGEAAGPELVGFNARAGQLRTLLHMAWGCCRTPT